MAEYWFNQANTRTPAAAAASVPEPEDETDVLDAITTKGAKGLDEILAKRGFVRRDEAERMVNTRAAQFSTENDLMTEYPDLRNKQSEFFRSTAQFFGELKAQGVPEATAMRMAAERAELAGIKAGKVKTPAQRTEDTRQSRIKAQAGDRNAPHTPEGSEGDDELTDNERRICAAMGITEEAYKARAQKGVQMSFRNAPKRAAK